MENNESVKAEPSVFVLPPREASQPPTEASETMQPIQTAASPAFSRTKSSGWASHKGYIPLGSPTAPSGPAVRSKQPFTQSESGDTLNADSTIQEWELHHEGPQAVDAPSPQTELRKVAESSESLDDDSNSQSVELEQSSSFSGRGSDRTPPQSSSQISRLSLNSTATKPLPAKMEQYPLPSATGHQACDVANEAAKKYEAKSGSLSTLPEQRKRIAHRNGVSFTLMVAGESGSGKTTFVQMLLGDSTKTPRQVSRIATLNQATPSGAFKPIDVHRTTEIEIHECVAEENSFEARFTIVDTPGFGDYTNNMYAWVPITNYIDSQYQRYMCGEEQPCRANLRDTRVHVCIYFLQPIGHELLPLDITSMKELGSRVNLVLVISKSDSQTVDEIAQFKRIVRDCVAKHEIPVFAIEEENPGWPYALVSSTDFVRASDGREVHGRQYDWGAVEVDNPAHSDLPRLKQVLMGTEMLNLIDRTHDVHYKKQRRELRLRRLGLALKGGPSRLAAQSSPFEKSKFSMLSPQSERTQKILRSPPPEVKPTSEVSPIDEVARRMTGLEILTAVSPFGYRFLEDQRIEEDLLYKQRVRGITSQFGVVLKFQLQRFEQEALELGKKEKEFSAELDELAAGNRQLEQRIAELEASTTRRKR